MDHFAARNRTTHAFAARHYGKGRRVIWPFVLFVMICLWMLVARQ